MCYSAMVRQGIKKLQRQFGAGPDYGQIELIFHQRLQELSLRIPRAFDANFDNPENADERRLHDLVREYRALASAKWEKELFAQAKRLADAERVLQTKETKAARESARIAGSKVKTLTQRLADLKRTDVKPRDSRIFPMSYAPIVLNENGGNKIVLARYHCRQNGKPASYDRTYPGLYNARRDNLEKFWRNEFGHGHAIMVVDAFFENVERDGKNAVLQFVPKPPREMLVACLFSYWGTPGVDGFYSFAAVTDEPPPEVSAAGHDRCIVNIKEQNIDAWLDPEGREIAELRAILDDVERPYYEHEEMAA